MHASSKKKPVPSVIWTRSQTSPSSQGRRELQSVKHVATSPKTVAPVSPRWRHPTWRLQSETDEISWHLSRVSSAQPLGPRSVSSSTEIHARVFLTYRT